MNQFTLAYLQGFHKRAAEAYLSKRDKPDGMTAEDIVPMDSISGALSDLFLPASHGGHRAGRSEVMGKSTGQKVPFSVKSPMIHSIPGLAIGGTIGAIGGGLIGNAVSEPEGYNPGGGFTGAMVGGSVGSVLGSLLAAFSRRKSMKKINEGYDQAESVTPYARRGNPLAFAAGSHETGRAEGLGAMLGQTPQSPTSNTVSTVGDLMGSGALSMGGSIAGKVKGRRKIKDLLLSDMGYVPSGFGASNRTPQNLSKA